MMIQYYHIRIRRYPNQVYMSRQDFSPVQNFRFSEDSERMFLSESIVLLICQLTLLMITLKTFSQPIFLLTC